MSEQNIIYVGIGDFKVGVDNVLIKTYLGSCVGICLYDKTKQIGGLLHIMLPTSQESHGDIKVAKYADTGMQAILHELSRKHHVAKENLVAKIFGGARVLKSAIHDIGRANIDKVKEILKEENIRIIAEKLGGEKGYKLCFNVADGSVLCQVYKEQEEKM